MLLAGGDITTILRSNDTWPWAMQSPCLTPFIIPIPALTRFAAIFWNFYATLGSILFTKPDVHKPSFTIGAAAEFACPVTGPCDPHPFWRRARPLSSEEGDFSLLLHRPHSGGGLAHLVGTLGLSAQGADQAARRWGCNRRQRISADASLQDAGWRWRRRWRPR